LFTFRESGTQVFPITVSHPSSRTTALPCLPLDIKDSLKEDRRVLLWRLFALGAFCFGDFDFGFWAFGFLVWEAFGKEKNY
jgi:hypothetical protein